MRIRTYAELRRCTSFEERFDYLRLNGNVGTTTFGFDRHINQTFYRSREWKTVRDEVIVRDNGCDLGVPDYEIHGSLLIHHINPLRESDLLDHEDWVLNPEYLITTTQRTHNAIHYGDESMLPRQLVPRTRNDTQLWTPLRSI